MMKIVVDMNILFAALGKKDAFYSKFLFDSSYTFLAPSYLFVELFHHKERIQKASKLSNDELTEHLHLLLSRISLIAEKEISTRSYYLAYQICKDIDIKDISYIALAIETGANIWTDDAPIANAIQRASNIHLFIPQVP